MPTENASKAVTFLEAVRESLSASGCYNSGDSLPPTAILWTDATGEWQPIVTQLRALMPELLTLGEYKPDQRTGPAIWLRCVIEGTLPEIKMPENAVPTLYLPNVSRQQLRSPEDCPEELKPFVELQYRGVVWTQVNGKDWTVEAFLVSSNGGLGLDVGRDARTRQAMLGALEALATTPISTLRGHKLESEDFDKLMVGDTIRDLLTWISDPVECKENWDVSRWSAFKSRCKAEYKLDPDSDGEVVAAENLGLHQDSWINVWQRFAESPTLYPGIPSALRRATPSTLLFDREPWPTENEKDEASLRKELLGLTGFSEQEARQTLIDLEKKHSDRRLWVWARMGLSPLVMALEHLKILAETTSTRLAGETPDAIGVGYTKIGYRADDAVLRALAAVKSADDLEAVRCAIRAVYVSWLDDTARNFQAAAKKSPLPDRSSLKELAVSAEVGECLLFVDGLRYDVAQRLLTKSQERQFTATEGYRWAGLPSVTPTAKPAVSPVALAIFGDQAGADFCPIFHESQKPVTAERIRDAVLKEGYQVLHGLDAGQPQLENARAWSECGEFDSLGHKLQAKLASQIDEQLELLLDRIVHLLEACWRTVRVVTDHGWLLVPGGLPSMPLNKYLTECRWSRCAVIKDGAQVDIPTAGWFWDAKQAIAFAPGAYCFTAGMEYTHGGMSLQECLIPDVTFSNPSQGKSLTVTFESVQWLGQRCRVVIKPPVAGLFAALRSKTNDSKTTIGAPKPFDSEGRAGLLVEDETLAGTATSLVVLDAAGRIFCKQPTIIGGDL